MNLNSPPSPFPAQKFMEPDPILSYHSSSITSCHNFFNQTEDYDPCGFEFGHPDGNYGGGSRGLMIKNTVRTELELSLWKKEDDQGHTNKNSICSKIKNPTDRITLKLTSGLTTKLEDHQKPHLSCNTSLHNNSSIRVCSDCNTTKTPLWRSGPKGPKSLCNACGIRQRKARRAMAATAAAAANGCTAAIGANKPQIKVHREKTEKNLGRRPHASQIKKRCKGSAAVHEAGSGRFRPNNGPPKRRLEDLLINLSKKLAIHRVFPEDEKDAAILLMALSYGLVHG